MIGGLSVHSEATSCLAYRGSNFPFCNAPTLRDVGELIVYLGVLSLLSMFVCLLKHKNVYSSITTAISEPLVCSQDMHRANGPALMKRGRLFYGVGFFAAYVYSPSFYVALSV